MTTSRSPSLIRLLAITALAAWLGAPSSAWAGGKHHVPNLRGEPSIQRLRHAGTMLVPLTVHVARTSEARPHSVHRVNVAVARANEALAAYGLRVVVHKILIMPDGFDAITRRRHHRQLAEFAPLDGTVHMFLVDRLELGSRLSQDRGVRGMHWSYRGLRKRYRARQYVVINRDAPSTTLVHELGHLFGLEHAEGHSNLMCSCRRGNRQVFTPRQGMTMRREARLFFRRTLRVGTR